MLHLYLYHLLYETGQPTDVEVALPGVGTAHRIDPWTGEIRSHHAEQRGPASLVHRLAGGPWLQPGRSGYDDLKFYEDRASSMARQPS